MYLTFDDRKIIEDLYNDNMRVVDIAKIIGVSFRTVYVELRRGKIDKLTQSRALHATASKILRARKIIVKCAEGFLEK